MPALIPIIPRGNNETLKWKPHDARQIRKWIVRFSLARDQQVHVGRRLAEQE